VNTCIFLLVLCLSGSVLDSSDEEGNLGHFRLTLDGTKVVRHLHFALHTLLA
jgi:hypothetical protein